MTKPIVEIENVSFHYDKAAPILQDISFSIFEGEFFGIIGPNGGGKTTLLKLLLGILSPKSGFVKIFDEFPDLVKRQLGYVPQEKDFNKGFPVSVLEVVLMGRLSKKKLFSRYNSDDIDIAMETLKSVNMESFSKRQINELSGGQKQRIYIARALTSKPKILLLDEPSAGIDPKFHNEFYELMKEINKTITIIIVTHDIECLSKIATGIAYINKRATIKRGKAISEKAFFEVYHTL